MAKTKTNENKTPDHGVNPIVEFPVLIKSYFSFHLSIHVIEDL